MNIKRIIKHLSVGHAAMRRTFPPATLDRIKRTIAEAEQTHAGQIRFAVEAALDIKPLLAGQTARERAIEVFSNLRVWDTEHNNGVLIYLLLADRDVEIVADRGIHVRLGPAVWESSVSGNGKRIPPGQIRRRDHRRNTTVWGRILRSITRKSVPTRSTNCLISPS